MHLISALAAGVGGAGSGTATLYRRGTTTLATTYSSFEGTATTTNPVTLDANGGATVYVNDVVDITVRNSSGVTVRQFTDGYSSQSIEVRSTSFTGTDYTTGASAVEAPIALTTLLDKWDDSAGADDFWVKPGAAAATRLKTAFGPISSMWFNVQDATYGATGDGTDQTSAINSAISACDTAGGGIVYFPPGTYLHTGSMLSTKTKVSLLGAGAGATVIKINHATNHLVTIDTASTSVIRLEGITFDDSDVSGLGSSGSLVKVSAAANVSIHDCYFTRPANSGGAMFDGSGTTARVFLDNCVFSGAHASAPLINSSCSARFSHCVFKTTAATYNTSSGLVTGTLQWMEGCEFDASASTAGTITYWKSSSTTLRSSIFQSRFLATGGATATAMDLGSYANNSYFFESNNTILCNTAYSYTAGSNATDNIYLGWRATNVVSSTSTSGTITVPADQCAHWVHLPGSGVSTTLTINKAPVGNIMTLTLGSTAGTPTWTLATTNFLANVLAMIDADNAVTSGAAGSMATLTLVSVRNASNTVGWSVLSHSTTSTWAARG